MSVLLKEKVHRKWQLRPGHLSWDERAAVIDFINEQCVPLVSKLLEVVKFITAIKPMTSEVIEPGCAACEEYVTLFRQHMVGDGKLHPVLKQKYSITSKMHVLEAHVPVFARLWYTVGFFGEDPVETLHKDFNHMMRTFCSVRNPLEQMQVMDDQKATKFMRMKY